MPRTLVTSALPYVNNIPHLGNLIGATLSADVYARHARLKGDDVLYVCGADEHGTATETKAREEGLSPQALCDKYEQVHREIYEWFTISFDVWGRTHTPTQTRIVQDIFTTLNHNGYINEQEVAQLYDEQAQTFLADRFVEGDCPHCGAPGARGDQCDACQQLINAPELKNPVSKLTGTTPVIKHTKHLFLDLPKLQPLIEQWLAKREDDISDNAVKTTKQWLADLKPRAITRDLSWGVPVPLTGYEDKVFYVWFDAPIGYISITAHARSDWEDWWRDPTTRLVQFMGKDNTVFHTVIFPGTLLGTKETWNTADQISITEFLNLEHGKFSKSRKTGVFGDDAKRIEETHGIPADAWRYYLLANRPETADSAFSWKDFQARINNELIANLGNLVHRTLTFITERTDGEATITQEQEAFLDSLTPHHERIQTLYEEARIREAVQELMALAKKANAHFQHREPWKTIKEDPEQAKADLLALATAVKDLSILAHPIIPTAAEKIQAYLNLEHQTYNDLGRPLPSIQGVHKPDVLFDKIDDDTIMTLEDTYTPQESPLDLRVAEITEAKKHPNADRLLVLQISLGDEKRQLVAGLAGHYTPEELTGKRIVVIANLEPAVLRGEKSEGMLLAGENGDQVGLLLPDAEPGTRLLPQGRQAPTKTISFAEFQEHTIKASKEAVTLDGEELHGASLRMDKEAYGKLR